MLWQRIVMDLSDAHARMIKDLYLTIEKRSNRNHSDSPEYDIQQMISDFYEDWFRNTKYSVKREKEGKFDIVVYEKNKISLLYEIKTFFKENENIKEGILYKDALKLSKKIDKLATVTHKYMLIAGNKEKLGDKSVPGFVTEHLDDKRNYATIGAHDDIKMRPSRKQVPAGKAFVMSWEVMS